MSANFDAELTPSSAQNALPSAERLRLQTPLRLTIENETGLPNGGPLGVTVQANRRDQHLDWTLPDQSRSSSAGVQKSVAMYRSLNAGDPGPSLSVVMSELFRQWEFAAD